MTSWDERALRDALLASQSAGFLGERPIEEAIDHSRHVSEALTGVTGRVVDLGAGGGLPGLVVAHDRPDLELTMVDRRTKRTDFLERIVRRWDLRCSVTVLAADVDHLVDECARGVRPRFDAAVARGFGPPDRTLRAMVGLVRPGGILVITEPPSGDRWPASLLHEAGVSRCESVDRVARFVVD